MWGYCQLKSNLADFLPRASNLNAEQSMSYEFEYDLIFVQIHLTWQYPIRLIGRYLERLEQAEKPPKLLASWTAEMHFDNFARSSL